MRRFSQRNSLVTLSDINITPLLDLAFVLLIIFVITRPLLEGNMSLQLPESGQTSPQNVDRRDIRVVEVFPNGSYTLAGKAISLRELERELVLTFRQNPKLIVDIRAAKQVQFDYVFRVLDACQRNHITQFTVRYAPLSAQ